jgi:endonuclease YncB( thermonuclease family)
MKLSFLLVLLVIVLNNAVFAQEQILTNPVPTPTQEVAEYDYDELFTAPKSAVTEIKGKVIGVYDGDTATVLDVNKRQYKIRFNGIDAPEAKQDYGQKSKQNLSDLIYGKEVIVKSDKTDKYGRTVGNVFVDGLDVNLAQIKAGFAWHYKKYSSEQSPEDRAIYAEAETRAQAAKLGLWMDSNPTPPWDWRRGVNHPNLVGVPSGSIIGNKNSMIYHTPGCSTYAKVTAANRVLFKTEVEAVAAGYRISGGCETSIPSESRPRNTSVDRTYIKGSRGGCYYVNASGKKTYVDKGLCQ